MSSRSLIAGALAGALLVLVSLATVAAPPAVQDPPPAATAPPSRGGDGASIDAVLEALSASVSGDRASERDWQRFQALFHPERGRLTTVVHRVDGAPGMATLTPAEYAERNGRFLAQLRHHEREVARRSERFGHLAQCWSTYELRTEPEDAEPFARGLRTLQLVHDGQRWWILSLLQEQASEAFPVPEEYLGDG